MSDAQDEVFEGTILKVPLTIEDEDTSEVIKTAAIWLHVTKADYEPSADPAFTNISIVAIFIDGLYHATITKRNVGAVFKKDGLVDDAFDLFTDLFPFDFEDLLESKEKVGVHQDLLVSAKLLGRRQDYDENGELNAESASRGSNLSILIKSNSKFKPTVGQFQMQELVDRRSFQDETDTFNWLDLYNRQNKELVDRLVQCKLENSRLEDDNRLLQKSLQAAKRDFDNLATDLESKFYLALNAKKDVIYQLTYESRPQNELIGLNRGFVEKYSKLRNIDYHALPSEDEEDTKKKRGKYKPTENVTPKRRKTAASSRKGRGKRRKKKSDEESSIHQTDESTDVDEKDHESEEEKTFPHTKIKKEPLSIRRRASEDDLEPPETVDDKRLVQIKVKQEPGVSQERENTDSFTMAEFPAMKVNDGAASSSQHFRSNIYNGRSDRELVREALGSSSDEEADANDDIEDDSNSDLGNDPRKDSKQSHLRSNWQGPLLNSRLQTADKGQGQGQGKGSGSGSQTPGSEEYPGSEESEMNTSARPQSPEVEETGYGSGSNNDRSQADVETDYGSSEDG
ncbi:uncharacterized protein LODBEIA_P40940 [Lodderomyces beijingensis]|uniref:Uncharacterized protein n=1 Tax=Lodderomyces beijingensis TaxID=1775926 RepID=A0ABP0ZUM8_9ASCO